MTQNFEVRDALYSAIKEEMERDDKIIILGEEIGEYRGAYKVTKDLLQHFGHQRVIDTPISEHAFAGLAIGAAFAGLKPIVEFMTFNFAMQAMDQIINSAAKSYYMSGGTLQCPIVFRGPNGSAAGVAAQHSQCFASWYAHIPGLKVVSPYFANDCKGLLKSAIRDNNPVIFLEHELAYGNQHKINEECYDKNYTIPIGKANIIQEGTDITAISFSMPLKNTIEAAHHMKTHHNIEVEIIDLRSLRPLDTETIITSLKKTNKIITIEEGWPYASIGSEICSIIMEKAFDYLDAPIARINSADTPLPYATNLEQKAYPTTNKIIDTIKSLCYI